MAGEGAAWSLRSVVCLRYSHKYSTAINNLKSLRSVRPEPVEGFLILKNASTGSARTEKTKFAGNLAAKIRGERFSVSITQCLTRTDDRRCTGTMLGKYPDVMHDGEYAASPSN